MSTCQCLVNRYHQKCFLIIIIIMMMILFETKLFGLLFIFILFFFYMWLNEFQSFKLIQCKVYCCSYFCVCINYFRMCYRFIDTNTLYRVLCQYCAVWLYSNKFLFTINNFKPQRNNHTPYSLKSFRLFSNRSQ